MSMLRRIALSSLLAVAVASSYAQQLPLRTFPPAAKFATLRVDGNFQATLNNEAVRLSPGMRLFTPQNMMVLPSLIVNNPVKVAYTLDVQGFVQQAWMLTDVEASNVKVENTGILSWFSSAFK